eukprot:TRINITY_DN1951_c1_g4_i2.p1 TRINITY_DN1951_c1_g4~~TRINITY_DN1951_c1_g4_i2.p1  ORF type:complete len:1014 (+),score=165.30 TRINITY_DN1951_c1_g4_i2:33-3074(+)
MTRWLCRRGIWTAAWRNDGSRIFENEGYSPYVERLCDGELKYFSTGGAENKAGDLPFEPKQCSEWDVDEVGARWKPSGDKWERLSGGGFKHVATGFTATVPVPETTATEVVRPIEEISFSNLVPSLTVRRRVASSEDDDYEEVQPDAIRVRIETGASVEFSEHLRNAICLAEVDPVDFVVLRSKQQQLEVTDKIRNLISVKLQQAESLMKDDDEQSFEDALECLLHILRVLSANTGKALFRTHLLSLMFNPLKGLHPLMSTERSVDYLIRTMRYISTYEISRNMSTGHQIFGTLSEAIIDVALVVRHERESSRFRDINEAKQRENMGLLQLASATHNIFLFWASVRPGGYSLDSETHFIAGVINGVFESYEHFVELLKQRALSIGSGWVWLAVEVRNKKTTTGDLKRFRKEEKKPVAFSKSTDLAVIGGTELILDSSTERLRNKVVGYDMQIITTEEHSSPMAEGYYPIVGVEIWADALEGRSIGQYIDDWLSCVDWRVAEFQLRSCYRQKLQLEHVTSCIPPLGSDHVHAVWLDILECAETNATDMKVREYGKIRKELSFLTKHSFQPLQDAYLNAHKKEGTVIQDAGIVEGKRNMLRNAMKKEADEKEENEVKTARELTEEDVIGIVLEDDDCDFGTDFMDTEEEPSTEEISFTSIPAPESTPLPMSELPSLATPEPPFSTPKPPPMSTHKPPPLNVPVPPPSAPKPPPPSAPKPPPVSVPVPPSAPKPPPPSAPKPPPVSVPVPPKPKPPPVSVLEPPSAPQPPPSSVPKPPPVSVPEPPQPPPSSVPKPPPAVPVPPSTPQPPPSSVPKPPVSVPEPPHSSVPKPPVSAPEPPPSPVTKPPPSSVPKPPPLSVPEPPPSSAPKPPPYVSTPPPSAKPTSIHWARRRRALEPAHTNPSPHTPESRRQVLKVPSPPSPEPKPPAGGSVQKPPPTPRLSSPAGRFNQPRSGSPPDRRFNQQHNRPPVPRSIDSDWIITATQEAERQRSALFGSNSVCHINQHISLGFRSASA